MKTIHRAVRCSDAFMYIVEPIRTILRLCCMVIYIQHKHTQFYIYRQDRLRMCFTKLLGDKLIYMHKCTWQLRTSGMNLNDQL